MVFSGPRLDKDIINVDLHVQVHHVMEDGCHGSLVGSSSILEAKGYDNITVDHPGCGERGLLLIFFCQADLVVFGETIHKGQHCRHPDFGALLNPFAMFNMDNTLTYIQLRIFKYFGKDLYLLVLLREILTSW